MPLHDYRCDKCKKTFEVFFLPTEVVKKHELCPKCGSKSNKIPSGHGGYRFESGPSSIRPRSAGSFKKKP